MKAGGDSRPDPLLCLPTQVVPVVAGGTGRILGRSTEVRLHVLPKPAVGCELRCLAPVAYSRLHSPPVPSGVEPQLRRRRRIGGVGDPQQCQPGRHQPGQLLGHEVPLHPSPHMTTNVGGYIQRQLGSKFRLARGDSSLFCKPCLWTLFVSMPSLVSPVPSAWQELRAPSGGGAHDAGAPHVLQAA